jgi:hypothetical protein
MEITGIKKIQPEKLIAVFDDFKKELQEQKIIKFTYDEFVEFVNRPENQSKYSLVAYKWHRREQELEQEYYGCKALCVFNLFLAFADSNNKFVLDDNGKKIKIINKLDKNLFEFL